MPGEIVIPEAQDRTARDSMRERIKSTATTLFIRHGYRGVSFGDIASRLGITRANIHYHFGNKQKLLDEVLEDYVDGTLARMGGLWRDDGLTFAEKLEGNIAFNRERYGAFNRGRTGGKHWSLITRMRNESDAIGKTACDTLQRFAHILASDIETGVKAAIRRGELIAAAPVNEIVVQAVSIANAAGTIAQDAGTFDRVDNLYRAFLRTVLAAYGGSRTSAVTAHKAGSRAVASVKARGSRGPSARSRAG